MPDPTTSANPARMNEFARRGWMASRAAGDFSYHEFEPLLGQWNELRAAQGVPTDWIAVHVGVLLHSYLNIDTWVHGLAAAFAAADGRATPAGAWPPNRPESKIGILYGTESDPDALVEVDVAVLGVAAAGPEPVPGPADVDPSLFGAGDPADPSSAAWALGNLGRRVLLDDRERAEQ